MLAMGALYRYLSFYHVYKVLESKSQFEMMLKDGWFPFIEILEEYKELSKGYQDNNTLEDRTKAFIAKLDANTYPIRLLRKWWKNPIFDSKKTLIQAGISAYLQDTKEGYINCIKNLCTEIEGILRESYIAVKQVRGMSNARVVMAHVIEKGKARSRYQTNLYL